MSRALLTAALLAALPACAGPVTYPDIPYADAGPFTCLPNLDGQIDASELQAALGVPVSYVLSGTGTAPAVDLVGQVNSAGVRVWDYSASLASDVAITLQASPIGAQWYASSFPAGQWSAPLDAADTLEGVYSADSSAMYLQGFASTAPSPAEGKTLVVYAAPVAFYRFPMKQGTSWTSTGTVTGGTVRGLAYAGTDTYAVADVATGAAILHDYTFTQVHRVKSTVTSVPAVGETVVTRQDSFLFECFGEVIRATARAGETNDDFTTAAELRRLGSD
jgi:hypothetical protein